MPKENNPIEAHLVDAGAPLLEALGRLNALPGELMTLFVTEGDSRRLIGSLTDGDVRRALLAGRGTDTPVGEICRRDCLALPRGADRYRIVAEARSRGVKLLPVTAVNGTVEAILDMRSIKTALPLDAVMMAGGKGERLRPMTLDTPKPLLKVGGEPIIDRNIRELLANGIRRVFITVNYLKEQLQHHVATRWPGGEVTCVAEPERLGTMGSLSLVEDLREENLIVMNSDLLTTVSFEKLYLKHIEMQADLTMATVPYTVSVPFAIVRHENGLVKALSEKPTYNYMANAGIYILRREVARSIPRGRYLDAPDLVDRLISEGGRVAYAPVEGIWVDIGSPDDFRYANELLSFKSTN